MHLMTALRCLVELVFPASGEGTMHMQTFVQSAASDEVGSHFGFAAAKL